MLVLVRQRGLLLHFEFFRTPLTNFQVIFQATIWVHRLTGAWLWLIIWWRPSRYRTNRMFERLQVGWVSKWTGLPENAIPERSRFNFSCPSATRLLLQVEERGRDVECACFSDRLWQRSQLRYGWCFGQPSILLQTNHSLILRIFYQRQTLFRTGSILQS